MILILDYGGSAIKYSLMDREGDQEGRGEVPAPRSIPDFERATRDIISKFEGRYEGISVSFPGFIQEDSTLTGGGAYYYYHGRNLQEVFSEIAPNTNICIENDGKCGALAEGFDGALADGSLGFVIILGTGVGGGILMDRKLIKGKHCTAGELSSYSFSRDRFSFGGSMFCSTAGNCNSLALLKGQLPEEHAYRLRRLGLPVPEIIRVDHAFDDTHFDGKLLFELLEKGDADAEMVYDSWITSLCSMISNIQIILAPDKICIGGGVTNQKRLIPDIRKKYFEMANIFNDPTSRKRLDQGLLPEPFDAEIIRCKHASDANQYGALFNYILQFD